ncbi:hypothetical protein O6P43_032076 [Quillaja saponaria]|uniref:Uncharacterized protein n=1 Tax=Quillaja saponaria TaxID=32244 RepID=A0AAD7KWT8_QUISA|nr:hypothetical protein O6P43_032076 [Quillaja saponaria]
MVGFPPPVYSGMEFSDSEVIEAMETKTEGVVKELAASSTEPDEIEVVNEGFKKEECDATNIGELEEKRNALTQDEGDGKKILIKLIQDCDKSDADCEVLIGIWNATVMICSELSMKVADFLVSVPGNQEKLKLQQFISLLEAVDVYEKSLVIKGNVETLEMVLDNLEQMKVDERGGLKDEIPIDDILKKFFDVILHLDSIMNHTGLPVSAALRGGELSKLEDGLKQCENEMEGISLKINALKVTFSFTLRLENNQFWLLLIEDMWMNMEFEVEGVGEGVKKLRKWGTQACVQSDSEPEGKNWLMVRLIKIVTELSQKLADFMVSLSRKEDKFQQFISRLRSFDEYKKCLVIRKIVHVLQMVKDNLEELKIESLLIMKEESDSRNKQNEDLDDESPTDDILKRFFDVILHLESIMSHLGLHEWEELSGVELSQLEDGLKQCEDELEGISLKVNDLKVTFSHFLRPESNELWKTILSTIEDMCNDMEFKEESEESETKSESS